MSLNIYFDGVDTLPNLSVVPDVEVQFLLTKLDGCSYDRNILEFVEQGKFVDNNRFLDRFGMSLRRDCLSTGSKAALCLYHNPDIILSGAELGYNALTAVIRFCDRGFLLLPPRTYYVECEIDDVPINVVCKGRHYTSLDKLSEYMMEDAPDD